MTKEEREAERQRIYEEQQSEKEAQEIYAASLTGGRLESAQKNRGN